MYGIFTYIYYKDQPHVGKYTSPRDGMVFFFFYLRHNLPVLRWRQVVCLGESPQILIEIIQIHGLIAVIGIFSRLVARTKPNETI